MREQIPSYDLDRGDELAIPFIFLPLERTQGSYNPTEPHRHNYYEIFFFVEGDGEHAIDFRTYPIRSNSIHFVSPGQVHQVRRTPETHGYILLFTAEFYAVNLGKERIFAELPFMSLSSPNPVLLLTEADAGSFLGTIRLLEEEMGLDRPHREEILRAYLKIFLVHARRIYEATTGATVEATPAHELLDRLRVLIERHFNTIHAAGAYAEMLSVSQNHLNTTVRKLLGRTIGDLVHERIILEAKRLLFHTELSVKEIAFRLNYDDPSYFTRFFRNRAGISPQEFREASRKHH